MLPAMRQPSGKIRSLAELTIMAFLADNAQGRQLMNDTVVDTLKAAPPAGVYVWQVLGLPISEIVSALTACYLTCLLIQFGYRFYKFVTKA